MVPSHGFYDIKETLIPQLHRQGKKIVAHSTSGPTPRVLNAASYHAVNEWMVERLAANRVVPDDYELSGSCLIHRSAEISRDATLVGPVIIGAGVVIGPRAVVVGPTSLGRDVEIGSGVFLSRTAVWRRCAIQDHAVIDRCILADDTLVPAFASVSRQVVLPQTVAEAERNKALQPWVIAGARWQRVKRTLLNSTAWLGSATAQ
jgi:NDP-sugar pyrophosphorylase family protein